MAIPGVDEHTATSVLESARDQVREEEPAGEQAPVDESS